MRIYHIADLHFGKLVHGRSMIEDQKFWVEEFLKKCDEGHPDAVLICGDVYDRANPTGDATDLLSYFLTELNRRNIAVFMIAGNHDSGQKLRFASELLKNENIHISGVPKKELYHFTMEDPDGPVTFWLLPYIFPEVVSHLLEDDSIRSYSEAVQKILTAQEIDTSVRNILLCHQNVVSEGKGAEPGGSESVVGGVGPVESSVFDAFDYVALGHIHSGLSVGKDTVRYAGTPLCYHFDETKFEKNKGLVEVLLPKKGEELSVHSIPIKPLHKMRYIEGTKEEVYDKVASEVLQNEYVGITITDRRIDPQIAGYLSALIEERNGTLFTLQSSFDPTASSGKTATTASVEEKPVEDLFSEFYTEQLGGTPPDDQEYQLLSFIGDLVRNHDASEKDPEKILAELLKITGGDA